jgi:hypothetical protein
MGVGENLNGSWGKFEWENGHFSRLFSRNIFRCFLEGKFLPLTGKFAQDCRKKKNTRDWALFHLQASTQAR